ncbi:MAG: chaperonin GroEL [bacterium]|nr:chaperonin GroEL [bacterium]
MSVKQLQYGSDARQKLKAGVDALAKAVGTTLGPKGRNVMIDKKYGAPTVTHDGVTVAKEIELADPFENMGAQMLKEAATKTVDVAGDGTSTATILAQAIIEEGLKNITAGANPMEIKVGLEKARDVVVDEIKKMAKPVSSKEEKAQVATISSASKEYGDIISEALEKVGSEGVVQVEEGKSLNVEVEYTDGMVFDKGYASHYFVTDSDRMESVVENPRILITDQKISSMQDLLPMLENLVKETKSLVIIADDIDGEALATLVVNKVRGTINALAVKAPGFGDRRKAMLEDIAILTGGTVISADLGRKLDTVTVGDLGKADKVVAGKDETTIIGGQGDKNTLAERIAQIRKQIAETDSDYDAKNLEERMAKLAGGVAVINVGAATEVELKEKKFRIEDAVAATKAAVEEGIVPGGGIAVLQARKSIATLQLNANEKVGADILFRALEKPLRMIVENAGVDAGWVVREVENRGGGIGYDVMAMEFVNMVESGIIDPAKVTRSAIQNAVSVAGMVLTTEALITDVPEKEKSMGMPDMGGGMPGY